MYKNEFNFLYNWKIINHFNVYSDCLYLKYYEKLNITNILSIILAKNNKAKIIYKKYGSYLKLTKIDKIKEIYININAIEIYFE